MKVFCRAVSDMSMASGCARLGMSITILALFRSPSAQALLGPAAGTQRQLVLGKKGQFSAAERKVGRTALPDERACLAWAATGKWSSTRRSHIGQLAVWSQSEC